MMDFEWTHVDPEGSEQNPSTSVNLPIHPHNSDPARVDAGPLLFYGTSLQDSVSSILARWPDSLIFHAALSADIVEVYLDAFDPSVRQRKNCSLCMRFLRRYGNLAVVDPDTGRAVSLLWEADSPFPGVSAAVSTLFKEAKVVRRARCLPTGGNFGVKESGGFSHLAVDIPMVKLERPELRGFGSASIANLAEMLERVLDDNAPEDIETAMDLLAEDRLNYATKHKGPIVWLQNLVNSQTLEKAKDDPVRYHNLLYQTAGNATIGFINSLRNGVLATLLEMVAGREDFATIERKWSQMAGPDAYMRPTTAPSAGNIQAAERLFQTLGLTKEDLRRRYVELNDIPETAFLWKTPEAPPMPAEDDDSKGIFSHLVPKGAQLPAVPSGRDDRFGGAPPASVTFDKFVRDILPHAAEVEYYCSAREHLAWFITGFPGTKPLMQWHTDTNVASFYQYVEPVAVNQYGLRPGWTRATSLIAFPHLWDDLPLAPCEPPTTKQMEQARFKYHGVDFLVSLEGIRDTDQIGLGLFPTFMKSEYHGIRATLEAHSMSGQLEMNESNTWIGGVRIQRLAGHEARKEFRVKKRTGSRGWMRYDIVMAQD